MTKLCLSLILRELDFCLLSSEGNQKSRDRPYFLPSKCSAMLSHASFLLVPIAAAYRVPSDLLWP